MKKLLLLALPLLLFSCASKSILKEKKQILKGNWTLNSITYSKTGDYKVRLLDDVTKECFENSSWSFVTNNNKGTYTIEKLNCQTGTRKFIFSIDEINQETGYYDMLIKPANNPDNLGYRFELMSITNTTMQWRQNLRVNGSLFLINMNFVKQ